MYEEHEYCKKSDLAHLNLRLTNNLVIRFLPDVNLRIAPKRSV